MERMYTPWRMSYIMENVKKSNSESESEANNSNKLSCVFCEMIREKEENDSKNLILLRKKNTFIVMNRFPYNSGHLMTLPNLHEGDLTRLSPQIQAELIHLTSFAIKALREEYEPHGFNAGINMGEVAGGSISPHLHFHIVPRWLGDTNYMPTIAKTKVLPESLETTYRRLHTRISKMKD